MNPTGFMAIDTGSNATKYRLWRIDPSGHAEPVDAGRTPLRLGRGAFTQGRLEPEMMQKAEEVFVGLLKLARRHGVEPIRAVGTSALRDAANAADLVGRIRKATGIDIRVISALEEARLIMEGVLAAPGVRAPGVGQYLLIDIGGGSTEVIATRPDKPSHLLSLPLGAVRLTGQFFPTLPSSGEQVAQAARHVERTLARAGNLPPAAGERRLLGGGGSITTLYRMYSPGAPIAPPSPPDLTRDQIDELIEEITPLAPEEIVQRYQIEEDRAEVILGGAVVARQLLIQLGADRVTVVWGGLCDGLLQDFLRVPAGG
ncbi:MAG TPA: hypothetical protein PLS90_10030 [Candidatus Sumerlaeota bacterium]|nr:hypothetical protein [Candidatus Sumerlaeota bacterium]